MSNRDRIQQLRAEADAAAKEKAEAKAAKAAKPPAPRKSSGKSAKTAPKPRVRIVWLVCDPAGREVQRFPYAQEAEARAAAQQLTESSGRTHFANQADVPVE